MTVCPLAGREKSIGRKRPVQGTKKGKKDRKEKERMRDLTLKAAAGSDPSSRIEKE